MKKIFTSIILLIFLSSCNWVNELVKDEKKDFLVETKSFEEFTNETILEKTWKLNSSQDIKLNSQANWRVSSVYVKDWEFVNKWQVLVKLEDSVWSYWINLERAQNWLDRAWINYDSSKINLDKVVFDSEVNLDRLNKNLQALKDNTIENLKLAETTLNNSDYKNLDSSSALQLQKLDNTIEKSELDYQNKLIADTENVNSMYNSLKKEYSTSMIFMDDIINFSDELLGITDNNKDKNDDFEDYLGAKDTMVKNEAEDKLKELIRYRKWDFENIDINNINSSTWIIDTLSIIEISYNLSREILNLLESTLNNSIVSYWTLSETNISTYIASVNIYQSTVQGNYAAFLGFDTNAKSFLRTYLNIQESTFKSIELMKKDRDILKISLSTWWESAESWYNKTVINSNDSIDTLELQIKSAKNSLENAIKTREVTLRNLDNSIKEARISYNQAYKEFNKLTIKSPISWIIWSIYTDIWQEINIWSPVLEIKNNSDTEITISFNKKELEFVEESKEVYVKFASKSYTWSIFSISKTADSNLQYVSKIELSDNSALIWNIVEVQIPITTDKILIPINIIKINNSWIWTINVFQDDEIKQIDLNLWDIYLDKIQVLDELDKNTQVIMTYIDNFDPEKFILKVK